MWVCVLLALASVWLLGGMGAYSIVTREDPISTRDTILIFLMGPISLVSLLRIASRDDSSD
jgi:hypothetical protein